MLDSIHEKFNVLDHQGAASEKELQQLTASFPHTPADYLELANEATEIEMQWDGTQYLRLWGPSGCLEMDEAYGIGNRIQGALPIGDNGGGGALLYMEGNNGWGLYKVSFGDLDREDAVWVASSLRKLLFEGEGIASLR